MGQGSSLNIVVLGRIGAPFGIKGWVHLQVFTDPPENILSYSSWYLKRNQGWQKFKVLEIRPHGKHFVALLEGVLDREQAKTYTQAEIGMPREELPELPENSHYWADLEGLTVINEEGVKLGIVKHLFETGANDVLVVQGEKKEHLIPYVPDEYILSVDFDDRIMRVHWDPEF
jgi:16S rRNA processing protein RimM